MSTSLPLAFSKLLTDSSLDEQRLMLAALTDNIARLESANMAPTPNKNDSDDLTSLVEHIEDLGIAPDLSAAVEEELKSFDMVSNSRKVKTKWLSPSSESYNYAAVINNPSPISEYPNICKLMELVNDHPATTGDMDSCLVSCFSNSKAKLSLHADNEALISQKSSICTVSFGAPRSLEFVHNNKRDKFGKRLVTADRTLPAIDHSMNIMKPGCQAVLKHRIPRGGQTPNSSEVRFSLSFRKLALKTPLQQSSDPVAPAHTSSSKPTLSSAPIPASSDSPQPSPKQSKTPPQKMPVVLIAGDSFPARLDSLKLGKSKKVVHNIAVGGSKIAAVQKSIEDYVNDNPNHDIKKLFISIGTNDIRYCKNGLKHLKPVVCELMKSVRTLLPSTTVYFQSLLPIPSNGCPYTERNVMNMNNMIYYLCSRYRMFYIDVFSNFLNPNGSRNLMLFPKFDVGRNTFDIHPNARGFGLLARSYIYLIHSRWFNPQGY